MKSSPSLSSEAIEHFGRTLFLAALRQHGVNASKTLSLQTLQRLLFILEEEQQHSPPQTAEETTHE